MTNGWQLVDKVFVLHVKTAKDRRSYIEKELSKHNLDFEFLTDYDISDITQSDIDKYFIGDIVSEPSAITSCSLKHIHALEKAVENSYKRTLIFEDDVILHRDFSKYLKLFVDELERRQLSNYLLNIEYGSFLSVPKSQRKSGQYIYRGKQMRCAAGYIVDYNCAESIMNYIQKNKCFRMFDTYLDKINKNNVFNLLWSYPTIVEQLSNTGEALSLIDPEKKTTSIKRKIRYKLLKGYKNLVSNFN